MFTGIIEEVGSIEQLSKSASSAALTIRAGKIFDDLKLGDSVAVNGVCLTVSSLKGETFCADVMHETLDRSTLGTLRRGHKVNLERALLAHGRLGGHIVSGHIDGTGTLTGIEKEGNATWYTVQAEAPLLRFVIEKGSIAIDGISLTVARITKRDFSVSVIPHTASETTLSLKKPGDSVNLENDLIGKYVERILTPFIAEERNSARTTITAEFLAQNGF